jgi:hypothetical protein
MKKQLINEAERLQQLAGINEMKVNAPWNQEPKRVEDVPEDIEVFLDDMVISHISWDNVEDGDKIEGVWKASDHANNELFKAARRFISDNGGKIIILSDLDVTYTALPNGNIGYSFVVEY